MQLQSRECQPLRTKKSVLWEKGCGQVEWLYGMFLLLFLTLLLCMQLQLCLYSTSSSYLEDALAASNLASAVIDWREYGISHTIRISDPLEAYNIFCDAVKGNLQLDEEWSNTKAGLISGRVTVENYTIFNVKGTQVTIYQVRENGQVYEQYGILGNVYAPNGIRIEATSVYSEIAFPVKGLFDMTTQAHKAKLVDIVTNTEQ